MTRQRQIIRRKVEARTNRVDAPSPECQIAAVKAKKSIRPASPKAESKGTRWAAELRAECNQLSDAEREDLLAEAMRLIYADESKPAHAHRR